MVFVLAKPYYMRCVFDVYPHICVRFYNIYTYIYIPSLGRLCLKTNNKNIKKKKNYTQQVCNNKKRIEDEK